MPDQFQYDVFLSHSSKDKAVVRPLAERLRADGLKVWFDEWEVRPGGNIPSKIDPPSLQRPSTSPRRFIPLRRGDATGSLPSRSITGVVVVR